MLATIAILVVMAGLAAAQWLNVPLPGTPRTPDGKPNLTAPAPKTPDGKPDLSGIWTANSGKYLENLAGEGVEVPLQPWAAAIYKERHDTLGRDKPQVRCLPHGAPDAMLVPGYPFKIIQTPGETIILEEEFNQYRQILTDGRALPVDPNPAWLGYSVGHWEADAFVVETTGFNDNVWLDNWGHPATEVLRVTERFKRKTFGQMDIEITIDDPGTWTKPWSLMIPWRHSPKPIFEYACHEGNMGMVGILAGARAEERAAGSVSQQK